MSIMGDITNGDFLTLLHEVAHVMRIRFDQRARQHGMTRAQWVILLKLKRWPGLTQKELAQMVEVEPMTVARLVDRLEAAGYVRRCADPADRRVWRLELLPEAQPLIHEIEAVRDEIFETLAGDLPREEVAQAARVLAHIKSKLACSDAFLAPAESEAIES